MKRTVTLLMLLALTCLPGLQIEASAQTALPDLVPYNFSDPAVTTRLGGPTLEFGILTTNIGGQDYVRPRDPQNPSQWLLRQIYEYILYQDQGGVWVEIDRRRKNTICTIDDSRWSQLFPCIRERTSPRFFCGGSAGSQGVSRGWSDDYFRGLNGQWSFIGDRTGRFGLVAILDPDRDLQRTDLAAASRDGDPSNNWAAGIFTWNGVSFAGEQAFYSFNPSAICATSLPTTEGGENLSDEERGARPGWSTTHKAVFVDSTTADRHSLIETFRSRNNSN